MTGREPDEQYELFEYDRPSKPRKLYTIPFWALFVTAVFGMIVYLGILFCAVGVLRAFGL